MYLRMCLASSAGLTPNVESTAAMQQQAPAIGRFVGQLVTEAGPQTQLVVAYVDVARQLLTAFNGNFIVCCCFIASCASSVLTLPAGHQDEQMSQLGNTICRRYSTI